MEKKIIERNLSLNNTYVFIDIVRGNLLDGDVSICENCGKPIVNIANVFCKETQQRHAIGLDCVKTIAKANSLKNNGSGSDYDQELYEFNHVLRFVTAYNKTKQIETDGFQCWVELDGKTMMVFMHNLKRYFPEIAELCLVKN